MTKPLRFLGIHIANGFSPEARVFASLLNQDCLDVPEAFLMQAQVIHHDWPGGQEGIEQFRKAVSPDVILHSHDFGWRPMTPGRSIMSKVRMRLRFISQLPWVLYRARRLQPDVIYSSQQFWDCQAATYLSRRLKRPQIIHLHYNVGPWLHKPVLKRLRDCDLVLAISEFIRGEALQHGVPSERVLTVCNSINVPNLSTPEGNTFNIRHELGISANSPLVGMIARLDPQKGQDHAIRVLASTVPSFPDANLLLVGSETSWHAGYEDSLRRLSSDLGIADRVRFLGHRRDIQEILQSLDVFLHPAHNEPFGLAVAEASAAGLPVVAYADGAMPELIEHGVTGLLSPRAASIEGVAGNLCLLLGDSLKAKDMGRAGRLRMQRLFTKESAIRVFHSALRDTLPMAAGADRRR